MAELTISNEGHKVLIDDEDISKIAGYRWYPFNVGAKTYVGGYGPDGKFTLMHRLLRPAADGHNVRFNNSNPLDCRKQNLNPTRAKSKRAVFFRDNRNSAFKGVSYHISTNKYIARAYCQGRQIWLGSFKDEFDAAAVVERYQNPKLSFDDINARAYQVFLTNDLGSSEQNWLEAEKQLKVEARQQLVKLRGNNATKRKYEIRDILKRCA
jgi:hypothetical protein